MKFYEQAKYPTLTNHMYNPQALTVSKKTWDKLSDDQKKIIQDAATEAALHQRRTARDAIAKALDQLKEHGMQVVDMPAEETTKLREKQSRWSSGSPRKSGRNRWLSSTRRRSKRFAAGSSC